MRGRLVRESMRRAIAALVSVLGPCAGAMGLPTITQRPLVSVPLTAMDQNNVPFAIAGMSGVTWRGGNEFVVAMDNSDKLVRLAVTFNPDASIATLALLGGFTIGVNSDHEGIAYTDAATNSVLVSSEVGPAIREFSLGNGVLLGTLGVPGVFTTPGNLRANFGFEALARRGNTGELWTANEEALVPDGPQSSQSAGTTIRIVRYIPGSPPVPAEQYAYVAQPWHGTGISGSRGGVPDLVALPSGKVLVVERSLAFSASGVFKNSIYLLGTGAATDVSALPGLVGQAFTAATKTLLWSGFLNQNLEGLCLGPRLASGRRVLFGVVDDGDPVSTNMAISFELDDPPSCVGDYDGSGTIGVQDLFSFLRGWFAGNPLADVDGSGTVTVQDLFTFLAAWFAVCP